MTPDTADRNADIRADRAAGATQSVLAEKYDLPQSSISRITNGVTPRRPDTAERNAAIREQYAAGADRTDLAAEHGLARASVVAITGGVRRTIAPKPAASPDDRTCPCCYAVIAAADVDGGGWDASRRRCRACSRRYSNGDLAAQAPNIMGRARRADEPIPGIGGVGQRD